VCSFHISSCQAGDEIGRPSIFTRYLREALYWADEALLLQVWCGSENIVQRDKIFPTLHKDSRQALAYPF
jgi:hypothetical protein